MSFSGKQSAEKWADIVREVKFLKQCKHENTISYKSCYLKEHTAWVCRNNACEIIQTFLSSNYHVAIKYGAIQHHFTLHHTTPYHTPPFQVSYTIPYNTIIVIVMFFLIQLVMEYCVGSCSDVLEGNAISFLNEYSLEQKINISILSFNSS
jgi:hypothetical protein